MIPFFNWDYIPEDGVENNNENEDNNFPEYNNIHENNNENGDNYEHNNGSENEENNFIDGKTRDEVIEWVQSVGCFFGYVIVIKRSKEFRHVLFKCDRGGIYKSQSVIRNTGTKKINCPFSVEARYMSMTDSWVFRIINLQHNHEPSNYLEGHAYARRFSENELELVADLSEKNVKPRDILTAIKKTNPKNVSTLKTVYNARQMNRLMDTAGQTKMHILLSFLQVERYIFHTRDVMSNNQLQDIFFAHPASLEKWRAFPHVLLIDATYKTNKYGLPLLEMVGLSSTNMTFCVAFVFMNKEKESNYIWALDCLKSTMDGCVYPRVIVTDTELALMNACKEVFPDATGVLCRWYIGRNIFKNCRPSIRNNDDWRTFKKLWGELENSETKATYTNNFNRLQNHLVNYPGVFDYLNNTWLTPHKKLIVSAWINENLNFGNTTTNRVESQHTKLKKYLESTQCDLLTALRSIHDVILSQDTAIKARLEHSRVTVKQKYNIPHFQQLQGYVSIFSLEEMFREYTRTATVWVFSENCGCRLRSSHGLPCAHEQALYISQLKSIPLADVDVFWKKLDLTPCVSFEDDNVTCEVELNAFREEFQKQHRSRKFGFLRKLKEIIAPSKTLLGEPSVHKNTRGHPSFKKSQDPRPSQQQQQQQQPRRCSYSGCFPSNDDQYMNQIPMVFHPYVSRLINVRGDGNCGFRAIAVAIGHTQHQWEDVRRDLIEELDSHWLDYVQMLSLAHAQEIYICLNVFKSPAPEESWWIMPECANLVANRYNVMLHVIGLNQCSTSLPIWGPPPLDVTQHAISIAHVDNNHFIVVKMIGKYPIPRITNGWNHWRREEATAWIAPYIERIHAYADYESARSQPAEYINLG